MSIITHHYFLSLFGLVFWFAIKWSVAKNRSDSLDQKFDAKKWRRQNYDDFIIGLLVAFALVSFDDEIIEAYNDYYDTDHPLSFESYYYLLSGPAGDMVYNLVTKFSSWRGQY